MQAIKTKYLGPTNTRGARIKASCDAGTVTVAYDYASAGAQEEHRRAKDTLCAKFAWLPADYDVCGWIGNECFWVETK